MTDPLTTVRTWPLAVKQMYFWLYGEYNRVSTGPKSPLPESLQVSFTTSTKNENRNSTKRRRKKLVSKESRGPVWSPTHFSQIGLNELKVSSSRANLNWCEINRPRHFLARWGKNENERWLAPRICWEDRLMLICWGVPTSIIVSALRAPQKAVSKPEHQNLAKKLKTQLVEKHLVAFEEKSQLMLELEGYERFWG